MIDKEKTFYNNKFMTNYCFRIRFLLSRQNFIDWDKKNFDFSLISEKKSFSFRAVSSKRISDAQTIDLISEGYSSEEEAYEVAERLRFAIRFAGMVWGIGIDFETDSPAPKVKELVESEPGSREYGPQAIDYGLTIYENTVPRGPSFAYTSIKAGTDIQRFMKMLEKAITGEISLSDNQRLAYEMYTLSFYEYSTKSKFIMMMTIIEVLSKRQERPPREITQIKKLIKYAKDESIDKKLIGYLSGLKKEYISEACEKHVKQYLGEEERIEFAKLYKIRSRLVHSGEIDININLRDAYNILERLVFDLLYAQTLKRE